ncbi:replicative DNA helicase [Lederbergia panacisoli]|uniref:replicative DNA helicase n=1 Tax=Lederbergia panacisoli TaxID=1255251 RepID=UPI00214C3B54|nr:DnaB-like helicase C-terminal domain-containing protein [Lederbergia panacisoli]MCR2823304.1 DNA helicase [Lederbergia panacisoli]
MTVEKALLGCMLKENFYISDSIVRPEHFEDPRHQALLREMRLLHEKGTSVDIITLTTTVDMEPFGGISYLYDLQAYASPEKFDEYEQLLLDVWKEREKRNILTRAREEDWGIQQVIHALNVIDEARMGDHLSITTALAEIYEAPWQEGQQTIGIPTGIKKLDQMTNGFQAGELTVIAARPSMGKTDVMLHFAKEAGWQQYLPIIFSIEMPYQSLVQRLIASTGRINRIKLRNPNRDLSFEQKEKWPETIGRVSNTNMQIFDGARQTIAEMRAKTRKLIQQFPDQKPIIFIDYLTLIRPAQDYGGNMHLQVTEISRDLKVLAKEMNCPVVLLAQLNRAVEQRQNKRPLMSDIRESGSVEQDADVIIFLYRDTYYDKSSDQKQLELIISKNRNGPVATVNADYNQFTGRIQDVNS